MKRFFDSELEEYRSHIARMLLLTHQQMQNAVVGLLERNNAKSEKVLELEKEVDHLDIEIDSEAIRYLNLRAPIASELRLIMAGSRMSHEFERIGDEAKKIAKRALRTNTTFPEEFVTLFNQMYLLAESMFDDIHVMFSEATHEMADPLIQRDTEIDLINKQIKTVLIHSIETNEIQITTGIELISCSRALERIGDHAKNIAEIMVFLITGEDIREDLF
jgi:phosphate transport system protein